MDIYSLDKPLGWLDEATQQALKDHYYDGGKVEIYTAEGWVTRSKGEYKWDGAKALIHRAVRKSEVVEVVRYGKVSTFYKKNHGFNPFPMGFFKEPEDTHKITFNLVDGVPDCNSIRMEKL